MRITCPAVAQLHSPADLQAALTRLAIDLPFDERVEMGPGSAFARPYTLPDGFTIGNRFCAQPLEGWDGTAKGQPSKLTKRRWQRFGQSGAKLIWGGEAVAICHEGRSSPNQLLINRENLPSLAKLRHEMVAAHAERFGSSADLLDGLQLHHSGRFSRPDDWEHRQPVLVYHHPYLDRKFGVPPDYPVLSDEQIEVIINQYIEAAGLAAEAGFGFVDIKHCHGYLGHEFLTAYNRPGPYGGSFLNRTRFLRRVILGIRQRAPRLRIGVRLSVFDLTAFERDPESGTGRPVDSPGYPVPFGADPEDPTRLKLDEPVRFLELLRELGVVLVNLSAGCSCYNPHIMRPARYPNKDGYLPPEDPLVGVARQINVCADLKKNFPELCFVGSAYSYLQEWLPNVAQYNLRHGRVDFIGLGRMLLPYPDYPADILAGKAPDRKHLCRSFSDCTTAPRNSLVSGCYPMDAFYKKRPEAAKLKAIKKVSG